MSPMRIGVEYRGRGLPAAEINRRVAVRAPDGLEADPCVDALRVLANNLNAMAAAILRYDRLEERRVRARVQAEGLDGMDMQARARWGPRVTGNLALAREACLSQPMTSMMTSPR